MDNKTIPTLKVFLCHSSSDKAAVLNLYKRLISEGIDAWLDQEKLLPGQDWREEIPHAVREADIVIICLSNNSITKEGYVQTEIAFALDIAKEKPEGTIFLIPTRLEECKVPDRLNRWQWVDLFSENGYGQLMRSLRLRADKIGTALNDTQPIRKNQKKQDDQLYDSDLLNIVDSLDRSGKAQISSRRSLCIQIGINPALLPMLHLSTEHDFAVEFIYHLHNTKNYQAMFRLCNSIEPLLGEKLATQLKQIYPKLLGS